MKFWVVRILTERGVRYATYQAEGPSVAATHALSTYPGALQAQIMREEGTMERQVREAFGDMYQGL